MKSRSNSYTYTIVIAIALVLLALFGLYRKHQSQQSPQSNQQQTQTSSNTSPQTISKPPQNATTAPLDLELNGILKKSDAPSKGNYMVVTSDKTLYVQTARNYDSMVGKQVTVAGHGSTDNFQFDGITLNTNN